MSKYLGMLFGSWKGVFPAQKLIGKMLKMPQKMCRLLCTLAKEI